MQKLVVGPGSLESAAGLLRSAQADSDTLLARAIVADLADGLAATGSGAAVDLLPHVVALLGEHTTVLCDGLQAAAGAYRRAEWLAQVAVGGAR
ncbi:hypothetical protein [Flexivirga caeni]|uniref:Uncharacterized protein n=1 Tax=Flexivirga caeni TaxID=2294115 RepID=A0A3M9MCK6_9MICO|nr:hypothetical protein [Flexivirga caeni]RNI23276.1 hypothetical protein EFY87_07575 [Flexivirga caeni]